MKYRVVSAASCFNLPKTIEVGLDRLQTNPEHFMVTNTEVANALEPWLGKPDGWYVHLSARDDWYYPIDNIYIYDRDKQLILELEAITS